MLLKNRTGSYSEESFAGHIMAVHCCFPHYVGLDTLVIVKNVMYCVIKCLCGVLLVGLSVCVVSV